MSASDADRVTSMMPHQLTALRTRISTLEQERAALNRRIEALKDFSRESDTLALSLIQTRDAASVSELLKQFLEHRFAASHVRAYISPDSSPANPRTGIFTVDRWRLIQSQFCELLHRGVPLCDSLQAEHIELLFNSRADEVQSTLLLPVNHPAWQGLLAVASPLPGRFEQGNELDRLGFITALTAATLNQ